MGPQIVRNLTLNTNISFILQSDDYYEGRNRQKTKIILCSYSQATFRSVCKIFEDVLVLYCDTICTQFYAINYKSHKMLAQRCGALLMTSAYYKLTSFDYLVVAPSIFGRS